MNSKKASEHIIIQTKAINLRNYAEDFLCNLKKVEIP